MHSKQQSATFISHYSSFQRYLVLCEANKYLCASSSWLFVLITLTPMLLNCIFIVTSQLKVKSVSTATVLLL